MNRDRFNRVAINMLTGVIFTALACCCNLESSTVVAQTDNQFAPPAVRGIATPSHKDATFTPDPYYSPEVTLDGPLNAMEDAASEWTAPGERQGTSKQPLVAASEKRSNVDQPKNKVRSLLESETWEPPLTPVSPRYDPSKLTHSPIPWLQQPDLTARPQQPPAFSMARSTPTQSAPKQAQKMSANHSIIRPSTISPMTSGTSKMVSNEFAAPDFRSKSNELQPAPSQTLAPALTIPRPAIPNKTSDFSRVGNQKQDDAGFNRRSDFALRSPKSKSRPKSVDSTPAGSDNASSTDSGKSLRSKPKPRSAASSVKSNVAKRSSVSSANASPSGRSNVTARPSGSETFEPTQLLALVGGEPIFVGDTLLEVNQLIEQHMGGAPESIKARERRGLIMKILPKLVNEKMLYVGALQDLPEEADIEKIVASAAKEFDEKALPELLKKAKVKDPADYDALLRRMGSSLRKRRDAWARDQLTRYFIGEQLDLNREITHQQLLDEYRANVEEYKIAEKSKWEQIMVRFDRFDSRDDAREEIVTLGNRLVHGASLPALAKKSSHGFRADQGGQHDWTGRDALVLKELDEAIFSLPIGKLSDVIETRDGLHIVRVIDRQEAGIKPFTEAQADIKKRLKLKMREDAFEQHLAKLKKKIPVEYFTLESNDVASHATGSLLE